MKKSVIPLRPLLPWLVNGPMASTTNDMSLIRVLSPWPKALTAARNWLPISHVLNIVEALPLPSSSVWFDVPARTAPIFTKVSMPAIRNRLWDTRACSESFCYMRNKWSKHLAQNIAAEDTYPVPIESNRSLTITVAKKMNMIDATSFSIDWRFPIQYLLNQIEVSQSQSPRKWIWLMQPVFP